MKKKADKLTTYKGDSLKLGGMERYDSCSRPYLVGHKALMMMIVTMRISCLQLRIISRFLTMSLHI